jgi:predicted ATPase
LDLASGISTDRLNESEIEVRVPRTSNDAVASDFVNIADVGLAVSTVLSVLVALIQAEPGQLVYIEQPELHLHPRAQWKLAQLLADAANRGVRLVIETHSSLLLQGILTQVGQDKISNDKVILHWFERNPETGVSKVESVEPDSMGRVGEWPEDFSDVEMRATNDYLDAVESKLYAEKK